MKVHWRTWSQYLLETKIFNSCTLIRQTCEQDFFRVWISQSCCKQDSDQDSYLLDQYWNRTRKNLSPNISGPYLVAETSSVSSVVIAPGYLRSNAQNRHPLCHLPCQTEFAQRISKKCFRTIVGLSMDMKYECQAGYIWSILGQLG